MYSNIDNKVIFTPVSVLLQSGFSSERRRADVVTPFVAVAGRLVTTHADRYLLVASLGPNSTGTTHVRQHTTNCVVSSSYPNMSNTISPLLLPPTPRKLHYEPRR